MTQAAPHPRMHGLTHVTGGPDPVPGLLPRPGTDIADLILALGPDAFWKLDETTGDVAYDSSGNDYHLKATGAFGPPDWGQPPGPPGATSAGWVEEGTQRVAATGSGFAPPPAYSDDFTVGVWAMLSAPITSNTDTLVGQGGNWMLVTVGHDGPPFRKHWGVLVSGVPLEANNPLVLDTWYMVAAVRDAGTWKLYVDGLLQADTITTSPGSPSGTTTWIGYPGISDPSAGNFLEGGLLSYAFIVDRVMSGAELLALIEAAGEDHGGLVLGLDDDGNFGWVDPLDVTVNGAEETHSFTPLPPFTELPADPTEIDPALQWMMEQPFCWNGGEFEVAPRKWATIPFTSPLMERQSNVTGGSTTWFELDWDDPRSAGWVDPSRPASIIVPHDMPFFGDAYSWMQISLKLETPAVEEDTSMRVLRIFEATHQKPLLVSGDLRSACGVGHGAVDVFRDQTAFTPVDGELFATGDPGGEHAGDHGNIMFVPATLRAYYLPGLDWLPRVAGQATLKEGMRLVAQVWHDATVPLTFDCSDPYPWRPHFVFTTPGLRAWGPPWSDWPEDED